MALEVRQELKENPLEDALPGGFVMQAASSRVKEFTA
jgi:hypothetical protein